MDQAPAIIDQVRNLYDTYLLPSSHTYLQVDRAQVANIAMGMYMRAVHVYVCMYVAL